LSEFIKSGLLVALTVFMALPASAADLSKAYAAIRAQDYETAASMLAVAIKADPRDATARRYLAAAYTGLQQPEAAIKFLRTAQALNGVQAMDAGLEFRARVCYTRLCIQKGETAKARRELQSLTATRPTGKDAAELRALTQELNQSPSGGGTPPPSATNAKG
jgi:tetratricopeptide (TPR) repeat protein